MSTLIATQIKTSALNIQDQTNQQIPSIIELITLWSIAATTVIELSFTSA